MVGIQDCMNAALAQCDSKASADIMLRVAYAHLQHLWKLLRDDPWGFYGLVTSSAYKTVEEVTGKPAKRGRKRAELVDESDN